MTKECSSGLYIDKLVKTLIVNNPWFMWINFVLVSLPMCNVEILIPVKQQALSTTFL